MKKIDFYDLMEIDPLTWGKEVDPIGLLSYQAYKRKRLSEDSQCWDGYKKVGTKIKNGKEVNNCVKEDEQLDEVLTLQQRTKRKILMRRLAPRIARARKIAMRRRAGIDVLQRRAKALARRTIAKKLLGGKNKSDVSPSERARIEKIMAKRKTGIERLAKRLLPKVRKQQAMRFAAKNRSPVAAPPKPATNQTNK
jgi:hypothetical protein